MARSQRCSLTGKIFLTTIQHSVRVKMNNSVFQKTHLKLFCSFHFPFNQTEAAPVNEKTNKHAENHKQYTHWFHLCQAVSSLCVHECSVRIEHVFTAPGFYFEGALLWRCVCWVLKHVICTLCWGSSSCDSRRDFLSEDFLLIDDYRIHIHCIFLQTANYFSYTLNFAFYSVCITSNLRPLQTFLMTTWMKLKTENSIDKRLMVGGSCCITTQA